MLLRTGLGLDVRIDSLLRTTYKLTSTDPAGKGSYSSISGDGTAQELLGRIEWENSNLTCREIYELRTVSKEGVGKMK